MSTNDDTNAGVPEEAGTGAKVPKDTTGIERRNGLRMRTRGELMMTYEMYKGMLQFFYH